MSAHVGHHTLPQEFFDITSSRLLVQPEPQYLYCMLWKMALNAAFNAQALQMGISPARAVPSTGAGYLQDPTADRLNFSDPIMGDCITVVPELGKSPGDVVRVNRPSYANTTYTLESRTIPSGTSISTTPTAIGSEQAAINILRLGGPYDATQAAVAPFAIEKFDAERMVHSAVDIVGLHLTRDFDKFIDAVIVLLYDRLATTVFPTGMTAITDAAVAGDYPMSWQVVSDLEQSLRDANVPTFPDGKWALVMHPRQANQMQQDKHFTELARYNPLFNPLYAGSYWADAGAFRMYQSTTLSTTSSTVTIYNGHAFGPGVIGSGVGNLPRVATSTDDNYGEAPLVIWLMYAGFTLFDSRLGARFRTS